MIGSVIGSLICLTAADTPDNIRDVLLDTGKLSWHRSQELFKGYDYGKLFEGHDYGKLLALVFCAAIVAYLITPARGLVI